MDKKRIHRAANHVGSVYFELQGIYLALEMVQTDIGRVFATMLLFVQVLPYNERLSSCVRIKAKCANYWEYIIWSVIFDRVENISEKTCQVMCLVVVIVGLICKGYVLPPKYRTTGSRN